jgi:hypothetical protein
LSKALLLLLIVLVLGALLSGLYFLYRDHGKGERTLTALFFRIGFTLALILVLLVGVGMGWIKLHTI